MKQEIAYGAEHSAQQVDDHVLELTAAAGDEILVELVQGGQNSAQSRRSSGAPEGRREDRKSVV